MSDAAYRLEGSWPEEEFPHTVTKPGMTALQESLPKRYEYHVRYTAEGETIVELFEYVGRIDVAKKVNIHE